MKRSQKAWVSRREKRPYRKMLIVAFPFEIRYPGRIPRTRDRVKEPHFTFRIVLDGSTIRVRSEP